MTITDIPATANADAFARALQPVAFDLYRDIHKGIRAELFALTAAAGSVDPADTCGRAGLADHVTAVVALLESHAEHEDSAIETVLRSDAPELAEQIAVDHEVLDRRVRGLNDLARHAAGSATDHRQLTHRLYLDLASFTSAYLAHQDFEERVVMPAIEQAIGVEAVIGVHVAIVTSIPPDEMARTLALMLPAMNLDDRVEMLGGMREMAPPDAFAGVVSLARSVLAPVDFAAVTARLGLS